MFGRLMMLVVMMVMGTVMNRLVAGILCEGRTCEQQHRDRHQVDFAHNTNPHSFNLNYVARQDIAAYAPR
jgi:hypothetical protein